MDTSKISDEKEKFVDECLKVAAKYIQRVGTGIAGHTGLWLRDDLAILMIIQGGVALENSIVVDAYTILDKQIERKLTSKQVVATFGANKFAELLCDTLDSARVLYEDIMKEDSHIDTYVKERIAKAKATAPE